MALDTYGGLKAAVAALLNRSDLTTAIPDFVTLLEAQINRETRFRNRGMEVTATLAFSAGSATLPADFLEARRLTWQSTPRVRLDYLAPGPFEAAHPTDTPGMPVHYTIVGDTVRLGPLPNSDAGVSLVYLARLTALTADGDSNWLLAQHPDVYLYGAALHAAPYLGDDARLQVWAGFYERAAVAVAGADARARSGGAPVRPAIGATVV